MPIYVVNVQQVFTQPVLVQAYNEQDAIQKVDAGDGEKLDQHENYVYTLDVDTWTAQVYEDEQEQPPDASQEP